MGSRAAVCLLDIRFSGNGGLSWLSEAKGVDVMDESLCGEAIFAWLDGTNVAALFDSSF